MEWNDVRHRAALCRHHGPGVCDRVPGGLNHAPGDHPLVAALPPHSLHKKDVSVFAVRKEEAADADLWFPS